MAGVKIEAVKGTRDFYPDKMRFRQWLFGQFRETAERYGYEEFDGPLLEPFELFAMKSGDELVKEQTYTLTDRGGRLLAIRPEITPTLARMVAQRQGELRKPLRWYSIPRLWRYEQPQRGRVREFWQFNIDILGIETADADAEILAVAADLLRALGFTADDFVIRINNRYYLERLLSSLGIDTALKMVIFQAIDRAERGGPDQFRVTLKEAGLTGAQVEGLERVLAERDYSHFPPLVELFELLEPYGIAGCVQFDPTVVRGLAYYTGTVFEIWDRRGKFGRAIMGGGRYDELVATLGGEPLSATGIAVSDVVIEALLDLYGKSVVIPRDLDVFVATYSDTEKVAAIRLAQELRHAGLRTELGSPDSSLEKQLRQAARSGVRYAVVVAPQELAQGEVVLRDMAVRQQRRVAKTHLVEELTRDKARR